MGEESGREATPAEVDAHARAAAPLARRRAASASRPRAPTRTATATAIRSRRAWPRRGELLELCAELARHEGTSLEFITSGCLDGFSAEEVDLMARMSLAAQRPAQLERAHGRLARGRALREPARGLRAGGAARRARRRAQHAGAGRPDHELRELLADLAPAGLGRGARAARAGADRALRDPATRRRLAARARRARGRRVRALHRLGAATASARPSRRRTRGSRAGYVGEIAAQRGMAPFDALLDIVIADELRTVLWPHPIDDDDASWALRARVWQNEHVLLGGSDAGAHLDRMCGAPYATQFLADCLRGRKLMSLEAAVQALSDAPARLFGLRGRGRVAPGYAADLVLLDPERVGCGEIRAANDLPGGAGRLVADPLGVERVLVNGRAVAVDGRPTGDLPGTVLRSGRDTARCSVVSRTIVMHIDDAPWIRGGPRADGRASGRRRSARRRPRARAVDPRQLVAGWLRRSAAPPQPRRDPVRARGRPRVRGASAAGPARSCTWRRARSTASRSSTRACASSTSGPGLATISMRGQTVDPYTRK